MVMRKRLHGGNFSGTDLHAPVDDPAGSAKEAGLRYVTDARPGIARKSKGDGFIYERPGKNGASRPCRVRDPGTLARIKRLAIPPAWTNVWICPAENGHLQATGRDARGRKQYRYHPNWRKVRDETKYERMLAFGKALPRIRRKVTRDLALPGMPREKVLATLVRLLEMTLIRVGNDEYARENHSYGLTTLHNRHAKVQGTRVTFKFRGKHGREHEIDIHDPSLARVVRRCRDLPGQELFAYLDENGKAVDVGSADVNAYLREITGEEFTAKDFRTWYGTVLAALALREFERATSQREAKQHIKEAIEAVAKLLGNTPAICRKCYVHPEVIDAYIDGSLKEAIAEEAKKRLSKEFGALKPEEIVVMALLLKRLLPKSDAG